MLVHSLIIMLHHSRTRFRFTVLSWATFLASWFISETHGVGPSIKAKVRLLRDLPLGLYKSENLPPARKRDRTLIDMSLSIRSVDLDFASGTFKTDGWMSLQWSDPRYQWDATQYDGIESIPLPFSKNWAPEVILHNSVEEQFVYRQVGMLKHDGVFAYIISIHTKSACEPNFADFPFGVQFCQLKFGSWINEQYKVEYRIAENRSTAIAWDDFSSPTGWGLVTTDAHLESRLYPLFQEPSPIVVYDFAIQKYYHFDSSTGEMWKRNDTTRAQRGDQREF